LLTKVQQLTEKHGAFMFTTVCSLNENYAIIKATLCNYFSLFLAKNT